MRLAVLANNKIKEQNPYKRLQCAFNKQCGFDKRGEVDLKNESLCANT